MFAPIRFLNSPQPTNTSYGSALKLSVYTSVFVALFLTVFQPFGLSAVEGPYRLLMIASYGLPCFPPDLLISCSLVFSFRHSGMAEHWKVWHAFAVILLYILVIGASNYSYDCLLYHSDFRLAGLINMEICTASVGFFPSVVMFLSARAVTTSRNQTAAESLNRSIDTAANAENRATEPPNDREITLSGVNKDESVRAFASDICFLKSDGNYVEVVVAAKNAKHETKLLRATLKDMETQLSGQCADIVRCHRSYLVNKQRIASAEGNAMGLNIALDRDNLQVPVSRSFVAAFKA
jgi:hypothetical protein